MAGQIKGYSGLIWEIAKVIIISLAIIIPVRYFLIEPFYVKGSSMEPNFYNYEYLVIDELSYRLHEPSRGDVVVLRNPHDAGQFFIKRIVALPDEHFEVQKQQVFINDKPLDETSYLDESVETWGNTDIDLGENEYVVLGDNRNESYDSRVFGAVALNQFIGRAWLRAWPLTRLSYFTMIEYNN